MYSLPEGVVKYMKTIIHDHNKFSDNICDVSDLYPNLFLPKQIKQKDKRTLAEVGVILESENRSATMVIRNDQPVCLDSKDQGIELLPLSVAFQRYDWLEKNYSFKTIAADFDEFTAKCANQEPLGFFIYVRQGVKVTLPCQVAIHMATNALTQTLHNIVILEEDSQLELITGCVSEQSVNQGQHLSVEEYYIGKNAKFTSTMVHSWVSDVEVYPHAGATVAENGQYESNYISLRAAKLVKSNSQTFLNGDKATAKYLSIVLGTTGSVIDTAGNVYLNANNTSAELLHRGVCSGGIIHQGGLLIGNASCKAHVDCAGMLLDNEGNGYIESIPGIKSHHPDARMSHEASIGKIAPEQVEYLMSRGMEELEAISMLIRGFLNVDIEGLGPELDEQIAKIAEIAGHGEE